MRESDISLIYLIQKGMAHMDLQIDEVGDSFVNIQLKDWEPWFTKHKDNIDKMNMKTFNHRFRIYDGQRRYKLHKIGGKYIVKQCSSDVFISKHDFANKLAALAGALQELKNIVDRIQLPEQEPKINLETMTKKFKV